MGRTNMRVEEVEHNNNAEIVLESMRTGNEKVIPIFGFCIFTWSLEREVCDMNKIESLKNSYAVRLVFMPVMVIKKAIIRYRYLQSPDSWYLKTLKGIHAGKRCFIIGNGPSLSSDDLDRLKGEYTFAANRIYEIFDRTDWRPTFYISVDSDFLRENWEQLSSYDLGHMFVRTSEKKALSLGYPIEKLTRIAMLGDLEYRINRPKIWNDVSSYISVDVSNHFSEGRTVTFDSIQLAIYMGFTEIYLLGVDFSYSTVIDAQGKEHMNGSAQDYFKGKMPHMSYQLYKTNLHAYQVAKEYCDNHGIIIKNATRGGKLEVFNRINFDELLVK